MMKRSVFNKKPLAEEKYTVPEIVTFLKAVNMFSTINFSKEFYVKIVREVIAIFP